MLCQHRRPVISYCIMCVISVPSRRWSNIKPTYFVNLQSVCKLHVLCRSVIYCLGLSTGCDDVITDTQPELMGVHCRRFWGKLGGALYCVV